MSYMVFGFGSYDVDDTDVKGIETYEEAAEIFEKRIKKWCKKHHIDLDDTDYCEGDDYFEYGEEEHGVAIYTIHEVPEFTDKQTVEKLLWDAKFQMDCAEYEATDYAWSLLGNCVVNYAEKAKDLIDEALSLMHP